MLLRRGHRILELASKAYSLWIRQDSFEKRKLLDILLSNCTFDGENLHPDYKEPFCWLAEGLECSDWLPFVDSFRTPLVAPSGSMLGLFAAAREVVFAEAPI